MSDASHSRQIALVSFSVGVLPTSVLRFQFRRQR